LAAGGPAVARGARRDSGGPPRSFVPASAPLAL
jgi:hypothetical protein